MGYTYGRTAIRKNSYGIYLRLAKDKNTIIADNQLKALLGLFETSLTTLVSGDIGNTITEENKVYEMDSTAGAVQIDLVNVVPDTEGQVLIFTATNVDNIIWITDEDSDVQALDAIGETIIYYRDATNWKFFDWANSDGAQTSEYTKVGACEEAPSIKVSEGEAVNDSEGNELILSESIEFTFNDMNLSVLNNTFISSIKNKNIDFIFCDSQSLSNTPIVYNVNLKAFLNIIGNALSKTEFSGKSEVEDADLHLTIYKAV